MTRIVHISDLHFGRTHPELLDPLLAAINGARPELVAVSGDLTQRARHGQFREARAFLDRLDAPWIAVPGNHDVPLDNMWLRILTPYGRYRRHVCAELSPAFETDGLTVQGFNTADPWRWQRGRVRRRDINAARELFQNGTGHRIVVAHHPFQQDENIRKSLMKHAATSLEELADCGADIVLSGHLHQWRVYPFLSRFAGRRVLQVHVGTGLSTRLRGEENDFAILSFDGPEMELTRMIAREHSFVPASVSCFRQDSQGWTAICS